MKRLIQVISAVLVIATGPVAVATGAELSPGSKGLVDANAAMHKAMAFEMTGDVDVDFMLSMIPHHEGAVAMAKVVLQYGKDPETRKLAEDVIKAQEAEIAFMKSWLEKKGVAVPHTATGNNGAH
jgi:uncharacterized protein (DUF305 family)